MFPPEHILQHRIRSDDDFRITFLHKPDTTTFLADRPKGILSLVLTERRNRLYPLDGSDTTGESLIHRVVIDMFSSGVDHSESLQGPSHFSGGVLFFDIIQIVPQKLHVSEKAHVLEVTSGPLTTAFNAFTTGKQHTTLSSMGSNSMRFPSLLTLTSCMAFQISD